MLEPIESRRRSREPARLGDRLTSPERSMEAMALDIERVAEAQRFTSRVLADGGGRPPGPALPAQPAAGARNPEEAHVVA